MLKLMLRRDDEFKGSERAIGKPACGRQACPTKWSEGALAF